MSKINVKNTKKLIIIGFLCLFFLLGGVQINSNENTFLSLESSKVFAFGFGGDGGGSGGTGGCNGCDGGGGSDGRNSERGENRERRGMCSNGATNYPHCNNYFRCYPLGTQTRTVACPAGQIGVKIQIQTHSCPLNKWSGWITISSTCKSSCVPQGTKTRTLSCPYGQSGSIIEQNTHSCPSNSWSGWVVTSNTCHTSCVPQGTKTRTLSCPYGQSGSIIEQNTHSCPSNSWSGWVVTSNTCHTSCVPQGTKTRTLSCPYGQSGSIIEQNTHSCPSNSWSGWVVTSNTCHTSCVPQGTKTRTLSCPYGQSGSIIEQNTHSCPSNSWSGWVVTSNTCHTSCVPQGTKTRTLSCPYGQSGSIIEQNTHSCPSNSWSGWVVTSNTCQSQMCSNGATNWPLCNNNTCNNGATNWPLCNNFVWCNGVKYPAGYVCPQKPIVYYDNLTITRLATKVGLNSAQLNGSFINNTGDIGSCVAFFDYGTNGNLTKRTGGQRLYVNFSTNYFAQAIYGLQPNTVYYYRAGVTCLNGTKFGQIYQFRTGKVKIVTPKPVTVVTDKNTCNCDIPEFMTLQVDALENQATISKTANYRVNFKNISESALNDVVIRVVLPEELVVLSADRGQFSKGGKTVILTIPMLRALEEGSLLVTVAVPQNLKAGHQLVINAYANYVTPTLKKSGSLNKGEVVAHIIAVAGTGTTMNSNWDSNVNMNSSSSYPSWLPQSLLEWLLFALVLVIFLTALRYLFKLFAK